MANKFEEYPSFSTAAMTFSLDPSATFSGSFSTRDTVAILTPASSATSFNVAAICLPLIIVNLQLNINHHIIKSSMRQLKSFSLSKKTKNAVSIMFV